MDGSRAMVQVAKNQALFRELNERTEALNEVIAQLTRFGSWLCECANIDCLERIDMTLAEYEALRETPTHFAVLPGEEHVVPTAERIVEKHDRYWVVEKLGVAGRVAAGQRTTGGA